MQRQGHDRRRSSSFHFDEESISGTEGTTPTSSMASSGAVLGDLVNTVPPILYGFLITGAGMHFSLPRAGTPLSGVAPADTTHVSLLTLLGFFFSLIYLLSNFSTL